MNSAHRKIQLRPARSSDTPIVREFLRTVWAGEDYVPDVWDEWLRSQDGLLIVAEFEDRPAGLGRLRDLGRGEWWMEGLRVDPELQGLGIASSLHEYLLERWLETHGSVVRLGTHARRKAVHHLCERTGFQQIARLGDIYAEAHHAQHRFLPVTGTSPLRGLTPDTLGLASVNGERLMDLDWAWASLRMERIEQAASSSIWSWGQEGDWVILHPILHEREARLLVQAFQVSRDHCLDFFSELRGLAFELGQKGVRLFPSFDLVQEEFWDLAGWIRDPDEELVLFERRR